MNFGVKALNCNIFLKILLNVLMEKTKCFSHILAHDNTCRRSRKVISFLYKNSSSLDVF